MTPECDIQVDLRGLKTAVWPCTSAPCAVVFDIDCDAGAGALPQLEAALEAGERASLLRIKDPLRRCRATVLRGALRHALGGYLEMLPGEVPLVREANGRPWLRSACSRQQLFVSSASFGAQGVFVVARGTRVGIDLDAGHEQRFPAGLAQHILHPCELLGFETLQPQARSAWLARAWVCKEAILKAMGVGLSMDPRRIDVMASDHPVTPRGGLFEPRGLEPWRGWLWCRGAVHTALAFSDPATRTTRLSLTV